MYYFNARWYDPTLGKFITEDPARDGVNWYAYCSNNPLNLIDPTGLMSGEEYSRFYIKQTGDVHGQPMQGLMERRDGGVTSSLGNYNSKGGDIHLTVHDVFDAAGFIPIPVVGAAAATIDVGIYMAQGDYTGAVVASVGIPLSLIPGGKAVKGAIKSAESMVAKDLVKTAEKEVVQTADRESKTLSEWLNDEPALLEKVKTEFKERPEWQGFDPDKSPVFLRSTKEVEPIRAKPGESGGHHPQGLALGGPEGQKLTYTGETRTEKNPLHTAATNLQNAIIKVIKTKSQ